MKALVTGGAGFIGSAHGRCSYWARYEVRVLDNLEVSAHPQEYPAYLDHRARLLKGDTRDRAAMESALDGVEAVFHLADHKGTTERLRQIFSFQCGEHSVAIRDYPRKATGCSQGGDWIFGRGVRRGAVLLRVTRACASRAEGSGTTGCGRWKTECAESDGALVPVLLREGRTNPGNPYGISKLAQEQIAFRLGKMMGIAVVALRYSNVQGPRQSVPQAFTGIYGNFVGALQKRKSPVLLEDGKQLRDFVHVSDAVQASMLVLDDKRGDGEAFNVGSGRGMAALDLLRMLMQKLGVQLSPEMSGTYNAGDARHSILSISRLQALGWKPTRGLNEMLEDYLAWLGIGSVRSDVAAEAETAAERAEKMGAVL